jgi:peptidylprolyl isomerase
MPRLLVALLCFATAATTGCIKAPDIVGPTPIEDETFAEDLGINLSKMTKNESGLYWQDLVVGDGAVAESGSEVTVHYTGWLVDGYKFDSSEGYSPISVTIDVTTDLILGWHEGLKGMQVGGTRKLIIPSHLGYGGMWYGPIPPNSTLVFDVKLIGVKPEEDEEDEG